MTAEQAYDTIAGSWEILAGHLLQDPLRSDALYQQHTAFVLAAIAAARNVEPQHPKTTGKGKTRHPGYDSAPAENQHLRDQAITVALTETACALHQPSTTSGTGDTAAEAGHGFIRTAGKGLYSLTGLRHEDIAPLVAPPLRRVDLQDQRNEHLRSAALQQWQGARDHYTYLLRGPHGAEAARGSTSTADDAEQVKSVALPLLEKFSQDFGVRANCATGVEAVKVSNKGADEKSLAKVRPRKWHPDEVQGVAEALEHYGPILGARRRGSTRAEHAQEVITVAAVTMGLENKRPAPGMGAEYIASQKAINLYAMALVSKDFGGGVREIEGTATHELAHGLLKYALPEFTEAFGNWNPDGTPKLLDGAEPPLSKVWTPMEDFKASIKASLLLRDRFAQSSPRHAAAIAELAQQNPDAFARKENELSGRASERIATELTAKLAQFSERTRTFDAEGWPNFAGERPITRYGATNPNEDLSETAKFYFVDPERLRREAPLRAAFFDGLVDAWTPTDSQ
ncbi:hypothetical protein ACIA8E_41365 [Streptomyces sp. NPDC051664]|uniref:hypothetical protein n=1 Tax=Streptomyces sp. NPDC051664 TaxID=3365668 RepID=UPI0037B0331A